ncbi:MAG TPA: hypothetical protein VEF06_03870 [Bryobacteraceae bacterium]|nr:hypothetical protein [Bryobacteraceae bacterium]
MRRFLEADVFIRLTATGFVETTRYFGLAGTSVEYEVAEPEEETPAEERLIFVRVRANHGRQSAG